MVARRRRGTKTTRPHTSDLAAFFMAKRFISLCTHVLGRDTSESDYPLFQGIQIAKALSLSGALGSISLPYLFFLVERKVWAEHVQADFLLVRNLRTKSRQDKRQSRWYSAQQSLGTKRKRTLLALCLVLFFLGSQCSSSFCAGSKLTKYDLYPFGTTSRIGSDQVLFVRDITIPAHACTVVPPHLTAAPRISTRYISVRPAIDDTTGL